MSAIDWDEIWQNVLSAGDAPDEASLLSATQSETTLRARARQMARLLPTPAADAHCELLAFQIASETYAVETHEAREVYPLKELTPIPCTPPFVTGLINVRGELCPVVDLKRLFGMPMRDLTNATRVVILHHGILELGIVVDTILGVRTVAKTDILPPPATLSDINTAFLRGVTPEHIVILDAKALLSHRGLVVNDHVDG